MLKGWEEKRLTDICEKITDGTHQTPTYYDDGVVSLSSKNVTSGKINWGDIKYIDTKQHLEMHKRVAPRLNDILLAKNGTTGVAAIVDRDITFDIYVSLALLRTKDVILPRFLLYFINSSFAKNQFNKRLKGIGVPNLHLEEIREVIISFPKSISEQQRIVSILDESFAAIAKAKEITEKNLQNARELFESYLQSVFGEAWQTSELVTLSDLTIDITDGDHMPPPKSPTGVPFITIGNIVKETREIDFTNTFMVPHAYFNKLKANKKPKKGDVLYTVTGSFGIPVIVNENSEFCFQRHIGLIRPNPETKSVWLYYLLLSPQVFKQADAGATGTAQRTVSLKLLRNLVVPRVTPEQQHVAVAKLDALFAETQRLENIYQQKLAALEELKQSILQKAFSGELTASSEPTANDELTVPRFIQQEMLWA